MYGTSMHSTVAASHGLMRWSVPWSNAIAALHIHTYEPKRKPRCWRTYPWEGVPGHLDIVCLPFATYALCEASWPLGFQPAGRLHPRPPARNKDAPHPS